MIRIERRFQKRYFFVHKIGTSIIYLISNYKWSKPFKCRPHKMVKRTQTIPRLFLTNCVSVLNYFVGLELKELITDKHFCNFLKNLRNKVLSLIGSCKHYSLGNDFSTVLIEIKVKKGFYLLQWKTFKIMKNAFYLILNIFSFSGYLNAFVHIENTGWL